MIRIYRILFLILILPALSLQCRQNEPLCATIQSSFSTNERPWVWWFWMGNIVNEKLIDQHLSAYATAGYGGVTIIPTYTVKGYESQQITYRSAQWYKMVDYTIQKARNLNMGVDLALTSAWPFGGPQVSKENGAKRLVRCQTINKQQNSVNQQLCKEDEYIIAASAFDQNGNYKDLSNLTSNGLLKCDLPHGIWTIEVVIGGYTGQMVKRSSPGGEGYVIDHFSPEAITQYLADFDRNLPQMKGIRATFNDSYEVYAADYTPTLLTAFEKRRGYSPKPYLHLLFDKEPSEIKQRFLCDYRTTMSELILDNFAGKWTAWDRSHGFLTVEQAHGAPANTLDLYGIADIPQCESFGPSCFNIPTVRIDPDTKRDRYKWPDKLFQKFASSAAHVNGRKLVSSETATWLTNHFRLALSQLKPQMDELFISGVNHLQLISSTNTPLDSPYPGWVFYPAPDFGPRASYFGYMPEVSNFIANSQHILQQNPPDNEILLYYPVADYFTEVRSDLGVLSMMDHIPTKWGNDFPFSQTARKLWKDGYSFDYISDKQIDLLGVNNVKMVTSGGSAYKTLIIPACNRIPLETMTKIIDLAQKGIKVVFDTRIPSDVPGLYNLSERLFQLNQQKNILSQIPSVVVTNNVDSALIAAQQTKETIPVQKLEYIRCNSGNGKIYFIANQDSVFKSNYIKLGTAFNNIEMFDPMTGRTGIPQTEKRNDEIYVHLELLPGQSVFLKTNVAYPTKKSWPYFDEGKAHVLKSSWDIQFEKGFPETPKPVKTKELVSWTTLGDSTNMFYTGTGVYSTTFDTPAQLNNAKTIRLLFSDLRDMATVYINGQLVGRTWSVPYLVDFDAKMLKRKGNKLTIKVSNIATNRIIWMDRHHIKWQECYIADPRKKEYNTADWEIQPAGIIGDIKLIGSKK